MRRSVPNLIGVLTAVVSAVACGAAGPPTPGAALTTAAAPATDAARPNGVGPEGFDRTAARVTAADGAVCDLCVWLADTPRLRARGLMGVTDLGAARAMAFRYAEPTTTTFWMWNTPMPLSIAYFGPDGAFLDSYDMEPCAANPCASYPTPDGFTVAVEAPRGELGELLIGPGATFELLDLLCDPAAAGP